MRSDHEGLVRTLWEKFVQQLSVLLGCLAKLTQRVDLFSCGLKILERARVQLHHAAAVDLMRVPICSSPVLSV